MVHRRCSRALASFVSVLSLAGLVGSLGSVGCSNDDDGNESESDAGTDTGTVVADTAPDTTKPDVAPDTTPDTTPDVAPDTGVDATVDTRDAADTADTADTTDTADTADTADTFDAFDAAPACTTTTGLVGYWPFEGDGKDISGNGLDVTLVGGIGFGTGMHGQALLNDGTLTKYTERTTGLGALNFAGDFTIQVWFSPHVDTYSGLVRLGDGTTSGWTFDYHTSDGGLFFSTTVDTIADATFSADAWMHVVVRRSGPSVEFFLGGTLATTRNVGGDAGGPIVTSTGPFRIGEVADNALSGRLDDVAIWNRALSDGEVTALWAGGTGVTLCPGSVGVTKATGKLGTPKTTK